MSLAGKNHETGAWAILTSVPDATQGFEVEAICDRCDQPAKTGMMVAPRDLPIARHGYWRHDCGGRARLPEEYSVTDRRSGQTFDLYCPPGGRVTVSVITRAELLRLSQAARAVSERREGAEERLDHVLAEAPEPVRRLLDLRPRTWEQWAALAAIVSALATLLGLLIKDSGGVSEDQLVTIVQELIQSHDQPDNPGREQQQGTGGGQSGVEPGDVGPPGAGGEWRPESPNAQHGA